jgi:hypothetical protein
LEQTVDERLKAERAAEQALAELKTAGQWFPIRILRFAKLFCFYLMQGCCCCQFWVFWTFSFSRQELDAMHGNWSFLLSQGRDHLLIFTCFLHLFLLSSLQMPEIFLVFPVRELRRSWESSIQNLIELCCNWSRLIF